MRTRGRDVRRLAHGRDRDARARGGGVPAAAPLQRRDQDRRARRPVLGALPRGRRRARRPLHLPARGGALPDGHQRRQPREGPRLVRASTPRASTSRCATRTPTGRCSPSRARGRAPRSRRSPTASCPRACAPPTCELAGVPALVCGTGYTGEDGCELLIPPGRRRRRLGRAARAGRGARRAWARATRCASRSASTSTATTCREDRNPIEAGLGWCCKLDTGFIGADALRDVEPEQTLVPFAFTGPGIPRQGNPVQRRARRGRGHERHACRPAWRSASGWPTCRSPPPSRAQPIEVDVRGKPRAAEVREKPLYEKEGEQWPRPAIPRT